MAGVLTLAVIVKNERRMLPELLEQHRHLADEIVVLDTGSQDGSPELAESAGARVTRVDWPGSFSEARNHSLSLAAHPWILVLDADERIAVGDHAEVRKAIAESSGAEIFRLIQRTYSDDAELLDWRPVDSPHARGRAGAYDVRLGRLFPRRPDLRFEGVIHEMIEPSAKRAGLTVRDLDVIIHHYKEAQSIDRQREKAQLYLELSRRKWRLAPGCPQAAFELAMAASATGHHAEAASALTPFVGPRLSLPLAEQLALALLHLKDLDALEQLVPWTERAGGERLAGLLGAAYLQAERSAAAEPLLRRATRHPGAAFRAFVDLGVALDALDQPTEADAAWREAERLHPESDLPALNRGRAARRAGRREEAEEFLVEARRRRADRWQTHALLAALALERGDYAAALGHARRAVELPGCGADGFLRACASALALGRRGEALGFARRAAALDPELSSVVDQLGGTS